MAVSAQAAPARIQFRVPAQTYSEALLDIAQQANVTLIGAAACVGETRTGVIVLDDQPAVVARLSLMLPIRSVPSDRGLLLLRK